MMHLHVDVERLALLGWRLHPASRRTRAACFSNAASFATCDLDQLAQWSCQYPGCSWRVVMQGSGIWALDIDVPSTRHKQDGVAALREFIAVHGPLPPRPTTRSGGGGLALFFAHQGEPIIGKGGHPAPGIDPRRGRQSITVPPSIHSDTGLPYRWLVAPWELAPPAAPDWLLRCMAPPPVPPLHEPPLRLANAAADRRRYALAALRRAAHRAATAPQGQRNDTLNTETFSLTRFLAEGTLDATEVATSMAYAARQAGLLPSEVKATLASALAAGLRR
jgi:Bifunctional DNA primase/polymerase, N-terminal